MNKILTNIVVKNINASRAAENCCSCGSITIISMRCSSGGQQMITVKGWCWKPWPCFRSVMGHGCELEHNLQSTSGSNPVPRNPSGLPPAQQRRSGRLLLVFLKPWRHDPCLAGGSVRSVAVVFRSRGAVFVQFGLFGISIYILFYLKGKLKIFMKIYTFIKICL